MIGPLVLSAFTSMGWVTGQDVLPTFIPYTIASPAKTEEVCQYLQGHTDFEDLLSGFTEGRESTVDDKDVYKADIVSVPISEFVSDYDTLFRGKIMSTAKKETHRFITTLFPWEVYDYFVPKVQLLWAYPRDGIQWFRKSYRDTLEEGGFLNRLEQEDYFSAGRMAHHRSQYFWQALLINIDLYKYVLANSRYNHLKKPILEHIKHLKKMYSKWNNRRLGLYHMNYILLQARQMQLSIKLHVDQDPDSFQAALKIAQIALYENLINASQVAFYNECMQEKGLNVLERGWDKATLFFEYISKHFPLQENSKKPPPLSGCLKALENMIERDRHIDTENLMVNLSNWNPDDWELKPPNAFKKRFEDPEDTPSLQDFLFRLLAEDNIDTARLFSASLYRHEAESRVWQNQLSTVSNYDKLLRKLFSLQTETDTTLAYLADSVYDELEKTVKASSREKSTDLYSLMQECQDLSLNLFNCMVTLKWSLLKSVKSNFTKEENILERFMASAKRKGVRLATEGTLWDQTPDLQKTQEEALALIEGAEGIILKALREIGKAAPAENFHGFVMIDNYSPKINIEIPNEFSLTHPQYWNRLGIDLLNGTLSGLEVASEWGSWGFTNAYSKIVGEEENDADIGSSQDLRAPSTTAQKEEEAESWAWTDPYSWKAPSLPSWQSFSRRTSPRDDVLEDH